MVITFLHLQAYFSFLACMIETEIVIEHERLPLFTGIELESGDLSSEW